MDADEASMNLEPFTRPVVSLRDVMDEQNRLALQAILDKLYADEIAPQLREHGLDPADYSLGWSEN